MRGLILVVVLVVAVLLVYAGPVNHSSSMDYMVDRYTTTHGY